MSRSVACPEIVLSSWMTIPPPGEVRATQSELLISHLHNSCISRLSAYILRIVEGESNHTVRVSCALNKMLETFLIRA